MTQDEQYPHALPQGTILAGQYVIEKALGQGGFGITYKATDHKTGQSVAVKEFFPDSMAQRATQTAVTAFSGERGESFAYGKECFLQEAETLAKFIGNEHIVRVFSYFEENGTAYFVMEFIEGTSFDQYIKERGGKLPYDEAEKILLPVIDALAVVHAKGIVHRDVTPDNIYITKDGTVKLLDFGAARYSLGDKSRSLDVVLKHGFAPKEQYTRHGRQGAFTDVYTVGASFYFAVTGRRPPDSIDRLEEDDLIPPSSFGVKIPPEKEDAILKAMSVQPANRYQTMVDFREALMRAPGAGVQNSGIQAMQNTGTPPVAMPQGTNMQAASGAVQSGMQSGEQTFQPQPVQQRVFTAPQPQPVSAPQIPQSAPQPIPVQQISRNALQPEPVPQPVPEPVYIQQQPNVQAQPAPIPQNVGVQPIQQPEPLQEAKNKEQQPQEKAQKKKEGAGIIAGILAAVAIMIAVASPGVICIISWIAAFVAIIIAVASFYGNTKEDPSDRTAMRTEETTPIEAKPENAISFPREITWENCDYECYSDGTAVLKKARIVAGAVTIPARVAYQFRVTKIGDKAFGACISLTRIELPDSVTGIGSGAFGNCSNLTSIKFPAGVTEIGGSAFEGCSSLTSIKLPDSVTFIGTWAFNRCRSLTSIAIPDGVTKIGNGAFQDCSSLTSIVIPDGVTFIGDYAFKDCSSLTTVIYGGTQMSLEEFLGLF